ncbi:hypothetical protein H072_9025 [Dactylellina haptotyla CBS 200.50]|uniref:Uncharacterized protein n=1 Tax=Dactylellina haptotyla (strain CBS 200.50) TaxID=1284197 RepID=S8BPW1_DACHA|nr:hypothetical protein H072_9025 [Dactylellina haptotyla CBS 200.50]
MNTKPYRAHFEDMLQEVEQMVDVVMMNATPAFDRMSDSFLSQNYYDVEDQYVAMNGVFHPKNPKIDINEWLFHKEGPYTVHFSSSSQSYRTKTLTPGGYVRDCHAHRSEDIGYNFPREVMFKSAKPKSHPRKRRDPEVLIEEEEEQPHAEPEEIVRKMKKLAINKSASRRRTPPKMDVRDASEYKQVRDGVRKTPRY